MKRNRDLYAYLDAKVEYERLERQIEEIETRIEGLGVDYSKVKVQVTPNNDKLAEAMDELSKLHREAIDKQTDQVKKMQELLADIDSIEDDLLRDIMQRRYVEDQSWDDIARYYNYTWRHIQRLHKEAKDAIKK